MTNLFEIFFRAQGTRPWLVIGALLAATLAEGVGFATLLPLISVATDADGQPSSALHRTVRDLLASAGLTADVTTLLVIVIGILILRSLLKLFAMRYVGYATADVTTGLRRSLIRSLLQVRWRFLVSQPLGRIANVASSEAMRAGRAYTLIAELIANAIQAVIFSAVAMFVSWRIAVAALVVGAGIVGGLHFLVRMSRRAGWKQTQRTKELLVFLSDTLANLKPVKAMAKEQAYAHLLEDRVAGLHKAIRRQVVSRESLNNIQDIVVALVLGTGFWLAHTVWHIRMAELVVVGLLLYKSVASIGKVQKSYQTAVELESAYIHARELIAEAAADPEPNPGTAAPSLERSLVLERVRFGYGEAEVLRGLSLEVPAGSMSVLTGSSGAGKTTVIDLVLGLHRPTAGRVLVDGVDLQAIDLVRWRRLVGYVPQELILFHDTILANVTLGDETIDEDAVRAALETAGSWGFVQGLPDGLATVVGEKGAKLSGGQRQRIALARAIASRPKLLILDEVTSALDPETARDIVRNIRRLTDRMTVLAVTHRPELLDFADRVYRLEDGLAVPVEAAPVRRPKAALAG